MRRLAPREHGVLTDAFTELQGHLDIARDAAVRARTGGERTAYVELDQSASALDDLIELATRTRALVGKLSAATERQATAHGRAPALPAA
jgi:hypothetical protein